MANSQDPNVRRFGSKRFHAFAQCPGSFATLHYVEEAVVAQQKMRPQCMNVVSAGASAQSEENVVRE